MPTSLPPRPRRLCLAALLSLACAPVLAQPIEAGSQDALELPRVRRDDPRPPRRVPAPARHDRFHDRETLGAVSPDLPPTLPPPRGSTLPGPYGYGNPGAYGENGYGGPAYAARGYDDPGYPSPRAGYAGRDRYGAADGYGATEGTGVQGRVDGTGAQGGYDGGEAGLGAGEPAYVAPFGGGPGNQTPIPLGAGSLYSGSAVNGTAVGPQFSNQLPAYEGHTRR